MMKLSDALRGAADRAPLGDVEVSVDATARRVRRRRTLRSAANGVVGVGAVGLLTVGMLAPSMLDGGHHGETSATMMDHDADGVAPSESSSLYGSEWGYAVCGAPLGATEPAGDGLDVAVAARGHDGVGPLRIDSAQSFDLTVWVQDPDAVQGAATVAVLWESMVVATATVSPELHESDGALNAAIEPFDCFGGAALPPGEYSVVVLQEVVTPVSADRPGQDGGVGSTPDVNVHVVAADALTLQINGESPADPFGHYFRPTEPGGELPDNTLTPSQARELFLANLSDQPWSMAPGTQRWLMPSDSSTVYTDAEWHANHYGCPWDASLATFPERSAELSLLEVDVTAPSTLDVSYGFVVEGNPQVSASVTNVSEYTIAGVHGPYLMLFLVRDGTVVAEAYPTSTQQLATFDQFHEAQSSHQVLDTQLGLISPGAEIHGEFLWRDVTSCWDGQDQPPVEPGTYTLLSALSVQVSSAGEVDEGTSTARPDPVDPYADQEWVELQLWSSLGSITITTN